MAYKRGQLEALDTNSGSASLNNKKPRMGGAHDKRKDENLCRGLLSECGLVFRQTAHKLKTDPATFKRQLSKAIKTHAHYPSVVDEFMDALQDHCSDPVALRAMLMPVEVAKGSFGATLSGSQESVMRMLLGNDDLQPSLVGFLLEKIPEYMMDEEDTVHSSHVVNMPKLIIGQLRWLDRVVDNGALTSKLLEMIAITPLNVQRDIITCIPEVVDDSEHSRIVQELRDLLERNTQLMVPVLDALSNLNLPDTLLDTVRTQVVSLLPSVDIDDLPVAVKFILQTTVPGNALETVNQLRQNLDLQAIGTTGPVLTSSQTRRGVKKGDRVGETLTMEALKSGIRFQKEIAEAWLKAIQGVSEDSEHRVLDVFVLLAMHTMAQYKTQVENVFRRKIKSGHLSTPLLRDVFHSSHTQLIHEYFGSVLGLCTTLLASPDAAVESFGRDMYHLAYQICDPQGRQQLVAALVTHIGSASDHECDSALDVLLGLVQWDSSALAPYAIFVKGILDYLDNLKMGQTRKLFAVLSLLAFVETGDGANAAHIQDDIHMVIRKQLSNNSQRYKRIGVIGAVSVLRYMAAPRLVPAPPPDDEESMQVLAPTQVPQRTVESFDHVTEEQYRHMVSLLEMVVANVKAPDVQSLLYDELARCLMETKLYPALVTYINDNIATPFQDLFIVDQEAAFPTDNGPPEGEPDPFEDALEGDVEVLGKQLAYDLDKPDGSIALNILGLLLAQTPGRGDTLAALCAQFKLLQLCERQLSEDGDLGTIDALLGCPILLPTEDKMVLESLQTMSQPHRETICHTLLYALNWFRELLNAFSTQNDVEMHGKIIMRLQNVVEVEKVLEACLATCPFYSVPAPLLHPDDKGRKKAVPTLSQKSQKDTGVEKPGKTEKGAMLQRVMPYLRELEMDVFTILTWESGVQQHMLDSRLESTKQTDTVELKLPQIRFLLEDLASKLAHVFCPKKASPLPTAKKQGSGQDFSCLRRYSVMEIVDKMVTLLPHMCSHLENIVAQYQALLEENDGVVDLVDPNALAEITPCITLLLQCFTSLLSCELLRTQDQRQKLKDILIVFATRTRDTTRGTAPTSLSAISGDAFDYLAKMGAMLPCMHTRATLFRLLVALTECTGSHRALMHRLSQQAGDLLQAVQENAVRDDQDKEAVVRDEGLKPDEIGFCIHHHVLASENAPATLESLVEEVIPKLIEVGGTKGWAIAVAHIKAVGTETIALLKRIDQDVDQQQNPDEAEEEGAVEGAKAKKMIRLAQLVSIFSKASMKVRASEKRAVLSVLLKSGRYFLETFNRVAMPFLDAHFRTFKDDILSMLKNLQHLTRTLQTICGHTKVCKDTALTNHVPGLKRAMEIFIFRVKAMLEINSCRVAFWLGNLKHRNIRGEEVSSQAVAEDPSEDDPDSSDDDDESIARKRAQQSATMGKQKKARRAAPNRMIANDKRKRAKKMKREEEEEEENEEEKEKSEGEGEGEEEGNGVGEDGEGEGEGEGGGEEEEEEEERGSRKRGRKGMGGGRGGVKKSKRRMSSDGEEEEEEEKEEEEEENEDEEENEE